MPPPLKTALSCLIFASTVVPVRASAEQPTLSGRWSATPMRADWIIGDWGEACGPKPSGGGAPAGTAMITQTGSELRITGAGRSYSTTECWEQFPGLARTSHSGGARGWRNVCKTAPGDPRQATLITNISATDNRITFDETGQYQFVIKGQNCTASARRTRSFTLVQREGEAPPEPAAPPSAAPEVPAPAPTPEPAKPTPPPKACATPGEPARLEVRPSRKLMRPGETFAFRAQVVDEAGCVLNLQPAWKLLSGADVARLIRPGTIEVPPEAPEANAELEASIRGKSLRVLVEIVSSERYAALLAQNGLTAQGESTDAAVTRIATGSIGARSAVARDDTQRRRIIFVGIIGGAAVVLGLIGLWMVRHGRRADAEVGPSRESAGAPPSPPRIFKVCPTCREEYPADATFCPHDGNRLVHAEGPADPAGPTGGVCPVCGHGYDPGVAVCPKHQEELVPVGVYAAKRMEQPVIARKICPLCGTQFPGDSQFCGRCGAALVPVN